jgi:hypothetical protein
MAGNVQRAVRKPKARALGLGRQAIPTAGPFSFPSRGAASPTRRIWAERLAVVSKPPHVYCRPPGNWGAGFRSA